jgi:cardiolipin synthase
MRKAKTMSARPTTTAKTLMNGAREGRSEPTRARRWVHLDNYIFQNDTTGKRFAEALTAKAAEGVPVRVLHDWFGYMDVPRSFWQELQEAGVEVRAVNPPTLGAPLGVIRRDHRKLLTVDGEYASTGGVCISDGWLVRSPETGLAYRDTAVSIRGPAVADVDRAFAAVWGETGETLPEYERPHADDIASAGGNRCGSWCRNRARCAPCECSSCSPLAWRGGSGSRTPTSSPRPSSRRP